jgi:hypothetical protein
MSVDPIASCHPERRDDAPEGYQGLPPAVGLDLQMPLLHEEKMEI